ncbi:MAG: phosphopantetheine-binding protein, partial [Firmicutes bacterium]|jgi:acyl carrier protein|nr:phosphopantetheine-binding protein [Bacillota bacterium]
MEKLLEIVNSINEKKSVAILDALSPNISLREDLKYDSLDLAELTVLIEDEYDIDIFEEKIVYNLGEIMDMLKG